MRAGQVIGRTIDHSVPQALADCGEISERQIRYHKDRNQLLRAIGGSEAVRPTVLEEPLGIEPGDKLLLCTDGFWEYVLELEMEVDLVKSENPKMWLEFLVSRLLARAPADHDNFTAMCAWRSEPISVKLEVGEGDLGVKR